jgi:hypothetical protein
MSPIDIRVRIGGDERLLVDADPQWVHQSIRAREDAGTKPCVEVTKRSEPPG